MEHHLPTMKWGQNNKRWGLFTGDRRLLLVVLVVLHRRLSVLLLIRSSYIVLSDAFFRRAAPVAIELRYLRQPPGLQSAARKRPAHPQRTGISIELCQKFYDTDTAVIPGTRYSRSSQTNCFSNSRVLHATGTVQAVY